MTVVALLIPIAALAARSPTDVRRDAQQALEYVTRADGPGAVILIRRGDRTLARLARGRASLELDVALSADHVFAIASVTKIMTAALLVDLERDGRLALDDTLATHLPDFPNAQHVTLRQLLQHTSGISDRVPAPQPGFSRRDIDTALHLQEIAKRELDFAPGTRWQYSNAGYIVLGAVIERVTRAPWHEAMRAKLFAPLGLERTGYGGTRRLVQGRVDGYTGEGYAGAAQHPAPISLSMPAAAGGLVSTADELARFMQALAGGTLLGAEAFAAMATPARVAPELPADYGYGLGLYLWRVRGAEVVGHTGQINGFAAALGHVPAHELTIVVLANDDRFDARTMLKRLVAVGLGEPFALVAPVPLPRDVRAALPGRYGEGAEVVQLDVTDAGVTLQRAGRAPAPLQWTASGRLHFVPDELSYFAPARDARGRIVALDYVAGGERPARRLARVD